MNPQHFSIPILHNSISIMTPFLLAAIGGLFTELSGMLNIALEGLMLIGAFFSVIFTAFTGSILIGILFGIVATLIVALLFGYVGLYLKANIFIAGLATNLLAPGITTVLAFKIFGNKGVIRFENIPDIPVLHLHPIETIPVIGDILIGHNILVYISWIMVLLAILVIYKTPFGLRLRGTGLNSKAIQAMGLKPKNYQLVAILISGFTAGIGGAFLTLNMGAFVPNITAGRGWIALVAIYLGNKKPIGIVIASFIFGFTESFSNYAQGLFKGVPADFILALPYIVTVVVMILFSIWTHYRERV